MNIPADNLFVQSISEICSTVSTPFALGGKSYSVGDTVCSVTTQWAYNGNFGKMTDGSVVPEDLELRLRSCCNAGQLVQYTAPATAYMWDSTGAGGWFDCIKSGGCPKLSTDAFNARVSSDCQAVKKSVEGELDWIWYVSYASILIIGLGIIMYELD